MLVSLFYLVNNDNYTVKYLYAIMIAHYSGRKIGSKREDLREIVEYFNVSTTNLFNAFFKLMKDELILLQTFISFYFIDD